MKRFILNAKAAIASVYRQTLFDPTGSNQAYAIVVVLVVVLVLLAMIFGDNKSVAP